MALSVHPVNLQLMNLQLTSLQVVKLQLSNLHSSKLDDLYGFFGQSQPGEGFLIIESLAKTHAAIIPDISRGGTPLGSPSTKPQTAANHRIKNQRKILYGECHDSPAATLT